MWATCSSFLGFEGSASIFRFIPVSACGGEAEENSTLNFDTLELYLHNYTCCIHWSDCLLHFQLFWPRYLHSWETSDIIICAVKHLLYLPSLHLPSLHVPSLHGMMLDALCLCSDERVRPVDGREILLAHLFLWRTVGLEGYLSLIRPTPVSLYRMCVGKGKVNINQYEKPMFSAQSSQNLI